MNTKLKATVAASAVALVGLAVLSILFGSLRIFAPGPDYTHWPRQPRLEMMPPDSDEFLEQHHPGPDGQDTWTEIRYRNGDRGRKQYRADHTLEVWQVVFPDGTRKKQVVYAKDGRQVVDGFEYRADRSLLWKASNVDGIATITTFYYDGKTTFSVVKQKIGDDSLDATYFRKSGKPWYHTLSTRYNPEHPQLQELWDKDGNRIYVRVPDTHGNIIVTYFRPDGTTAFVQTWGSYTAPYDYEPGMGHEFSPTTQTVLHKIEAYAADGKTVTLVVEKSDDGNLFESITKIAPDGTKSQGGNSDVRDELQQGMPKLEKPEDFWKQQETDATKRGEDAP